MDTEYPFLNVVEDYYYTDVLQLFCALIAGIIGFFRRKRFKELALFYFYPLASSAQSIYLLLYDHRNYKATPKDALPSDISVGIFLLIELTIIYLFLKQVLNSGKVKKLLNVVLISYYLTIVSFFTFSELGTLPIAELYIVQAILIIPPCTLYFYELFKNVPNLNLLNEPAFWICTGSLLYFLCTLPLFLSKDSIFDLIGNLNYDSTVYAINFICYSVFFLFIIKGYLCKPATKQ